MNEDRLIADMTFAMVPGIVKGTVVQTEPRVDEEKAEQVRVILATCGCKTAVDIEKLGCTGILAAGFDFDTAKFVQLNLAGSGVGLTCFVGSDRYCLVHETIGGLQEGQAQRHVSHVGKASRALTDAERAKVAFTEQARRVQGLQATRDLLAGRKLPENLQAELEAQLLPSASNDVSELPSANKFLGTDQTQAPVDLFVRQIFHAVAYGAHIASLEKQFSDIPGVTPSTVAKVVALASMALTKPWKCPDHVTTNWSCRYCAAAEIVKGPFEPSYIMGPAIDGTSIAGDDLDEVPAAEIDDRLTKFDESEASAAALFVKVARWKRKLTRAGTMIGGDDIIIDTGDTAPRSLDLITRCILRRWPHAVIESGDGKRYSYREIPFGKTSELFIYRDKASCETWSLHGATLSGANAMVHLLAEENVLTLVVDNRADPDMASIVAEARGMFTPSGPWMDVTRSSTPRTSRA